MGNIEDRLMKILKISNLSSFDEDKLNKIFKRAHMLHIGGKFDLAKLQYNDILKIKSDDPGTLSNLAIILYEEGETDKAINLLQKACKSNHEVAHFNLGLAYFQNHRFKEASKEFSLAHFINPKEDKTLFYLGMACYNNGNNNGAINSYKKLLDIRPNDLSALNNMAIAYYQMGDKKQAKKLFQKAVNLDPDYKDAMDNLRLCKRK